MMSMLSKLGLGRAKAVRVGPVKSGDAPKQSAPQGKPVAQPEAPTYGEPTERDDDGRGEIRVGLIAFAVLFIGGGTWASLAPLDAGVSAPGVVVVSGNRQTVQHREGGTISRILVKEGDRVKKDQVLVELAIVELESEERGLLGQAIELEALRARLIAEAEGADEIERPRAWDILSDDYAVEADRVLARQETERLARAATIRSQLGVLRQRSQQMRLRIEGHRSQVEATNQQLAIIEDELRDVTSLADKGLAPRARVRAIERSQAELIGRSGELVANIQQAQEAVGESRMQALALEQGRTQEIAAELRSTDTRLAEIAPQLDRVRSQLERSRIRAPASGEIVGLQVFTEGGVVQSGMPLMDIVPEAQPLVLEAQVDPRDGDDIYPEMMTEVRFPAFASRQIPILKGEITRISADRMTEERTGRAYFLAEVVVPEAEIARINDAGAELKPGLSAEVVVPLRKRTAMQYLLEPLNRALWKSFREH